MKIGNRSVSRGQAIVGAIVALILVCGFCGLLTNHSGNSSDSGTGNVGASSQAPTAKPAATHAPTATPKPKHWVTVSHLTGSGNSQTDTFAVKNGDHIVSSCTTDSDANLFIASLYNKGESYGNDLPYAELVDQANQACATRTYTVQQGDATVYLWVQADSVQWTVDVQRFE